VQPYLLAASSIIIVFLSISMLHIQPSGLELNGFRLGPPSEKLRTFRDNCPLFYGGGGQMSFLLAN